MGVSFTGGKKMFTPYFFSGVRGVRASYIHFNVFFLILFTVFYFSGGGSVGLILARSRNPRSYYSCFSECI